MDNYGERRRDRVMSSIGSSSSSGELHHGLGSPLNISIVFPLLPNRSRSLCYWKIKTNFYIEQSQGMFKLAHRTLYAPSWKQQR